MGSSSFQIVLFAVSQGEPGQPGPDGKPGKAGDPVRKLGKTPLYFFIFCIIKWFQGCKIRRSAVVLLDACRPTERIFHPHHIVMQALKVILSREFLEFLSCLLPLECIL